MNMPTDAQIAEMLAEELPPAPIRPAEFRRRLGLLLDDARDIGYVDPGASMYRAAAERQQDGVWSLVKAYAAALGRAETAEARIAELERDRPTGEPPSPPADNPCPEVIPEDSPRDRSRVINEVLCRLHRVPSEDLSRLPAGKPSEDRDIFEPLDLTLTDETLTPFHVPDRHPGLVYLYRDYDPYHVGESIDATYTWRPGVVVESGGAPWRLVSGRPDFRGGCWCMKWLARREN